MTLKYNNVIENKKLVQSNSEFLTLSRVLQKEKQILCPVEGILGLIKLHTFDEELFGGHSEN